MKLKEIVQELEGKSSFKRKGIICEKLESLGIEYDSGENEGSYNIVANHSGKIRDIAITCHYDVFKKNKRLASPGANDDGSGAAAVLGILRKAKQNPLQNLGIRGIFFGSEEQFRLGSQAYVCNGSCEGLIGVYNLDMVGIGDRFLLWSDYELYQGDLLIEFENQSQLQGFSCFRFPYGKRIINVSGDHRSFLDKGFDSVFCITVIGEEDQGILEHAIKNNDSKSSELRNRMPVFRTNHSLEDTSRYISEEALQMTSNVLWETLVKLDEKSAED